MPLGPEDVMKKSFKTSIFKRGYDEIEVDTFLEEVVHDLQRREAERDELLAKVQRPRTVHEAEAERVGREREQLDLIKTERQEIVSELGGLQARLTSARDEIQEAEGRAAEAVAAQAEAEQLRAAAQEALEEINVRLARTEAIYNDVREANDSMLGELRRLRTDTETSALKILGREPSEPVGTAQDDIAVIQGIAVALHEEHVSAGERAANERIEKADRILADATNESSRLLAKATEDHDALLSEATAERDRLVGEATSEHDRLLEVGASEHERLLAEGKSEYDRLLREASAQRGRLIAAATSENERLLEEADLQREAMLSKAAAEVDHLVTGATVQSEKIIREAEERRTGILADLQARQGLIEGRIGELDRAQSEYRERLRALMSEQLSALDRDDWEA